MSRSVIDSDSGDIIESQTVSGKHKIYIYPLDTAAVEENSKDKYKYVIGNHDQLSITVWGHPEFSSPSGQSPVSGERIAMAGTLGTQINQGLVPNKTANKAFFFEAGTGTYTVDEDGNVFLPMCGPIKVMGKTPKEVRAIVAKKLIDYVVNPQVSVNMINYRSKYAYVLGEVSQASMLPLNDVPLDLASALSIAGWVNLASADVKNIYVMRQGNGTDIKVYRLNATSPTAIVLASGFALQPSDVVFISTAGVAQFDRVMTHFLSSAEVLWYTRTAINPTTNIFPGWN